MQYCATSVRIRVRVRVKVRVKIGVGVRVGVRVSRSAAYGPALHLPQGRDRTGEMGPLSTENSHGWLGCDGRVSNPPPSDLAAIH